MGQLLGLCGWFCCATVRQNPCSLCPESPGSCGSVGARSRGTSRWMAQRGSGRDPSLGGNRLGFRDDSRPDQRLGGGDPILRRVAPAQREEVSAEPGCNGSRPERQTMSAQPRTTPFTSSSTTGADTRPSRVGLLTQRPPTQSRELARSPRRIPPSDRSRPDAPGQAADGLDRCDDRRPTLCRVFVIDRCTRSCLHSACGAPRRAAMGGVTRGSEEGRDGERAGHGEVAADPRARSLRRVAGTGPDVRPRAQRTFGGTGHRAPARLDGDGRTELGTELRPARRPLPGHRPRPPWARARPPQPCIVPPGGLRR